MHDETLCGIKAELPLTRPGRQFVKVTLELSRRLVGLEMNLQQEIISKKTNIGGNTIGQVVNVE